MLKRLSLAKSVVGRTGKFLGALICLPLKLPLMILVI
jgi:hypothetical protein